MEINVNEVVMLLLCLGVSIFVLFNLQDFKTIPSFWLIISGFFLFFAGSIATVLEQFFWPEALNLIEHLAYLSSSVIVFIWCWLLFAFEKRVE